MTPPGSPRSADLPLLMEEFMVPGADPGIELFVRNKRLASLQSFTPDTILLFVHGATYPCEASFDLQLDGVSWMDVLARQGFDVYFVDIRGYGRSTRPPEMSQPPEAHPPIVNTDTAARDYAAASDWIRARRGVPAINVMGHSWGTAITATHATRHPEQVNRLVLFAPIWLNPTAGASVIDQGGALGAYRRVTVEMARARKHNGLPAGARPQPDAWFDAWAQATLDSDPEGAQADPPHVRAPNGVVHDVRTTWYSGVPGWDPAKVRAPTLLILGEWDADTPPHMAQALFPLLVNAHPKKLAILGRGTHGISNELERFALFDEVERFLAAPPRAQR